VELLIKLVIGAAVPVLVLMVREISRTLRRRTALPTLVARVASLEQVPDRVLRLEERWDAATRMQALEPSAAAVAALAAHVEEHGKRLDVIGPRTHATANEVAALQGEVVDHDRRLTEIERLITARLHDRRPLNGS